MKKQLVAAAAAVTGLTFAVAPTVEARPTAPNSIVDVALAVNADVVPGAFDTLIAAVTCESQSAVLSTLSQRGQYTVFAPTDDAFAAIGLDAGNVCTLPGEVLSEVLLYHVAKGSRDAADVTTSDRIRMLNGEFTAIDGATIDGNGIIVTDVAAGNGIIHAIDGVLLPDLLTAG